MVLQDIKNQSAGAAKKESGSSGRLSWNIPLLKRVQMALACKAAETNELDGTEDSPSCENKSDNTQVSGTDALKASNLAIDPSPSGTPQVPSSDQSEPEIAVAVTCAEVAAGSVSSHVSSNAHSQATSSTVLDAGVLHDSRKWVLESDQKSQSCSSPIVPSDTVPDCNAEVTSVEPQSSAGGSEDRKSHDLPETSAFCVQGPVLGSASSSQGSPPSDSNVTDTREVALITKRKTKQPRRACASVGDGHHVDDVQKASVQNENLQDSNSLKTHCGGDSKTSAIDQSREVESRISLQNPGPNVKVANKEVAIIATRRATKSKKSRRRSEGIQPLNLVPSDEHTNASCIPVLESERTTMGTKEVYDPSLQSDSHVEVPSKLVHNKEVYDPSLQSDSHVEVPSKLVHNKEVYDPSLQSDVEVPSKLVHNKEVYDPSLQSDSHVEVASKLVHNEEVYDPSLQSDSQVEVPSKLMHSEEVNACEQLGPSPADELSASPAIHMQETHAGDSATCVQLDTSPVDDHVVSTVTNAHETSTAGNVTQDKADAEPPSIPASQTCKPATTLVDECSYNEPPQNNSGHTITSLASTPCDNIADTPPVEDMHTVAHVDIGRKRRCRPRKYAIKISENPSAPKPEKSVGDLPVAIKDGFTEILPYPEEEKSEKTCMATQAVESGAEVLSRAGRPGRERKSRTSRRRSGIVPVPLAGEAVNAESSSSEVQTTVAPAGTDAQSLPDTTVMGTDNMVNDVARPSVQQAATRAHKSKKSRRRSGIVPAPISMETVLEESSSSTSSSSSEVSTTEAIISAHPDLKLVLRDTAITEFLSEDDITTDNPTAASRRARSKRSKRQSSDGDVLASNILISPEAEIGRLPDVPMRRSHRIRRKSIELYRQTIREKEESEMLVDSPEPPAIKVTSEGSVPSQPQVETDCNAVHQLTEVSENIVPQVKKSAKKAVKTLESVASPRTSEDHDAGTADVIKVPSPSAPTPLDSSLSESPNKNSGDTKEKNSSKRSRKRKREPSVEDIYLNKLWRTQMPKDKTWETIFELPKVSKFGDESYQSAKKFKRSVNFDDFCIIQRLKRRRQKATKRGWKPMSVKREKAVEKLLDTKLAALEVDLASTAQENVSVVMETAQTRESCTEPSLKSLKLFDSDHPDSVYSPSVLDKRTIPGGSISTHAKSSSSDMLDDPCFNEKVLEQRPRPVPHLPHMACQTPDNLVNDGEEHDDVFYTPASSAVDLDKFRTRESCSGTYSADSSMASPKLSDQSSLSETSM